MERVGVFEAKARLSDLVAKAERGRTTTITRNGKAIARIVPIERRASARQAAAMDRIVAFSKTCRIRRKVDLRRLINEGRS